MARKAPTKRPIRPPARSGRNKQGAPKRIKRMRVRLPYWVLVRTQSGRENWARQNIEKQDIRTFLPRVELPNGKLEPLFPTYLFIEVINDRIPKRGTWGVISLVPSNERIEKVPPRVINQLLEAVNDESYIALPTLRDLKKGEWVKSKRGSFQFEKGLYIGTRDGRCRVLVSMLGRDVEVPVKRSDIEPTKV